MKKRDRVEATLKHQPVDRCAILEQLSFNPGVIADWTGKDVQDFDYTIDDICQAVRATLDLTMPPTPPRGTERSHTWDGFVIQNERSCGMDIVELKRRWPELVWSGGIDGVEVLERGSPDTVATEVRRHIKGADALDTGGMFVASSSEINPPIPAENFRAMVETVYEMRRQ